MKLIKTIFFLLIFLLVGCGAQSFRKQEKEVQEEQNNGQLQFNQNQFQNQNNYQNQSAADTRLQQLESQYATKYCGTIKKAQDSPLFGGSSLIFIKVDNQGQPVGITPANQIMVNYENSIPSGQFRYGCVFGNNPMSQTYEGMKIVAFDFHELQGQIIQF